MKGGVKFIVNPISHLNREPFPLDINYSAKSIYR